LGGAIRVVKLERRQGKYKGNIIMDLKGRITQRGSFRVTGRDRNAENRRQGKIWEARKGEKKMRGAACIREEKRKHGA